MSLLMVAVLAAQALPVAAPATNFATAPIAAGSWRYGLAPGGSAASFVDATGTSRLVVQCNRAARQVTISRISTTAAPTLQLWTDSAARVRPAAVPADRVAKAARVAPAARAVRASHFSP
jgi:hypothetical protein